MPKGPQRSVRSTPAYYHLTPADTPTAHYAPLTSQRPMAMSNAQYYPSQAVPIQASMSQQSYNSQSGPATYVTQGGPVQQPHMTHQQSYALPVSAPPVVSLRPSSGAWTPSDDQTLMAARAQGMNWAPIQQAYFPTKTPNACRKRHERLMERRNADDWDGLKLEGMARSYMDMRREIWSPLAAQTGEKWTVVEQKCMSQGLKNLQTAARSHARRERLDPAASSSLQTSQAYNSTFDHHSGHHPDGSDYADELEASASSDPYDDGADASDRSSTGYAPYGHSHTGSNGSSLGGMVGGGGGDMRYGTMHGGRLPSMDMGIDAIINRPGGGR